MSTESHVSLLHIQPIFVVLLGKTYLNSKNPIIRKARENMISEIQLLISASVFLSWSQSWV